MGVTSTGPAARGSHEVSLVATPELSTDESAESDLGLAGGTAGTTGAPALVAAAVAFLAGGAVVFTGGTGPATTT